MQATKAKSEAGILVLIVFILGLLVGGVGNHLWGVHVWGSQVPPHTGPGHQPPQPISQVLGLSPDQQKQLDAIFNDTHPKFEALDSQYRQQRDALRMQTRARIRAILTPDQQVKFDAMTKDQDAHARGRGPNRGGPPPGAPPSGSFAPPHSGSGY
jgi:Spy/CpxP family protein refolding chaperone